MPLTWRLTNPEETPTVDFLLISQAKSARREPEYVESLLELRDRIRAEARALGTPIDSSEYVCTAMDASARAGLRTLGFGAVRGGPPIHVSHTYLRGAGQLDLIERIVRGPSGTYARPHGNVLASYGRVESSAYNLLAFDEDPTRDDGARAATYWVLDKPPHDVIQYDRYDPLIGSLLETIGDRSGSSCAAVWRKKLGLGTPPEFWLEWRSTSPLTFKDLENGLAAWRAPRAMKALAARGWRFLAVRLP